MYSGPVFEVERDRCFGCEAMLRSVGEEIESLGPVESCLHQFFEGVFLFLPLDPAVPAFHPFDLLVHVNSP